MPNERKDSKTVTRDSVNKHPIMTPFRVFLERGRDGRGLFEWGRGRLFRGGASLVENGRQRPARRRMLPRKQSLGRLPRLEGLPHSNRLTKESGTHPNAKVNLSVVSKYAPMPPVIPVLWRSGYGGARS